MQILLSPIKRAKSYRNCFFVVKWANVWANLIGALDRFLLNLLAKKKELTASTLWKTQYIQITTLGIEFDIFEPF